MVAVAHLDEAVVLVAGAVAVAVAIADGDHGARLAEGALPASREVAAPDLRPRRGAQREGTDAGTRRRMCGPVSWGESVEVIR